MTSYSESCQPQSNTKNTRCTRKYDLQRTQTEILKNLLTISCMICEVQLPVEWCDSFLPISMIKLWYMRYTVCTIFSHYLRMFYFSSFTFTIQLIVARIKITIITININIICSYTHVLTWWTVVVQSPASPPYNLLLYVDLLIMLYNLHTNWFNYYY